MIARGHRSAPPGYNGAAVAAIAVLCLCPPALGQAQSASFDFYVLALSWSPSFCRSDEGGGNAFQCGEQSTDYGFVVHGLWPQHEHGYPEHCESRHPDRVPEETGKPYFDIMPGMGLIGHQWRKHGSCTGLSPQSYLEATREARDAVHVPASLQSMRGDMRVDPQAVEAAFIGANPGLEANGIAVTCDRDNLREIRICLTKELGFRSCPEVDADGCRRHDIGFPGR
ncbi:ribonuclease T2 family protein [Pararhizobium haloflavum]|uniref:ribonuclease T2 family protein n=1 Tax=Pararhizobium haloflavum TaxID=2037914 RepID=UPI001FDFD236|nr:ribonuclease [Pararhizobium haloflavum]